jgi:hypothetical protein
MCCRVVSLPAKPGMSFTETGNGGLSLFTTTHFAPLKSNPQAGHWWLTPIIQTTQEAEIKGIIVQNQTGQILCETLAGKKPITKKGW